MESNVVSMADIWLAIQSWKNLGVAEKLKLLQSTSETPGFDAESWHHVFTRNLLRVACEDSDVYIADWICQNLVFNSSKDKDLIALIERVHPLIARWLYVLTDDPDFANCGEFRLPSHEQKKVTPKEFWELDDASMCLGVRYREYRIREFIKYAIEHRVENNKIKLVLIELCRSSKFLKKDPGDYDDWEWRSRNEYREYILKEVLPSVDSDLQYTLSIALLNNQISFLPEEVFKKYSSETQQNLLSSENFLCMDIRKKVFLSSEDEHEEDLAIIDSLILTESEFQELWHSSGERKYEKLLDLLKSNLAGLSNCDSLWKQKDFCTYLPFLVAYEPLIHDKTEELIFEEDDFFELGVHDFRNTFLEKVSDKELNRDFEKQLAIAIFSSYSSDFVAYEKFQIGPDTPLNKESAKACESYFKDCIVEKDPWKTYLAITKNIDSLGFNDRQKIEDEIKQVFIDFQIGKEKDVFQPSFESLVKNSLNDVQMQLALFKNLIIAGLVGGFLGWLLTSIF